MSEKSENFTIGTLASAAEVGVETIRFYQRKGLLPQPDRPHGGIRRYGEEELNRVRFIKAAQRIGFTLEEVSQLLRLDDGTQCEEARAIAEHKLSDVRQRIADLKRIEAALSGLVKKCAASEDQTARCPIISTLNTGN